MTVEGHRVRGADFTGLGGVSELPAFLVNSLLGEFPGVQATVRTIVKWLLIILLMNFFNTLAHLSSCVID